VFNAIRSMLRNDDGATLVEYSLVVALIAGVSITAMTLLGTNVTALFNNLAGKVSTATKP
jgi:pilus assembly protein Flp/PilA